MCFQCGQTDHVKIFYLILSGSGLVGQSSGQPQAPAHSFGYLVVRPTVAPRFEARISSRAQRSQMRAQTHIFAMTVDEAQANSNTVIGIMNVFGSPVRVFFILDLVDHS